MGPRRRLRIYIAYDSPSIVKYLESMIRDIFITCFISCHFDELIFPTLGGGKENQLVQEIIWNNTNIMILTQRNMNLKYER